MENVLTRRRGRARVIRMDKLTPFQLMVQRAIGDEAIEHIARRCNLAGRWVIDDLFRKGTIPRKDFDKLCDGLGLDKRDALLLAHGLEPSAV